MKTIRLRFGESREGMRGSNRLYFFYVTPTGIEASLGKAKLALSPRWSRTTGEISSGRIITSEYDLLQPCSIKMVNMYSNFGKPRKNINLYLNLGEEHACIQLKGYEGFGEFVGNAEVDLEKSSSGIGQYATTIDEDFLKEYCDYDVLTPPQSTSSNASSRKLIW